MDSNQDGKRSPNLAQIKEGWERLANTWFIMRNRKNGDKIVVPSGEALKYLVGIDKEWEVEKSLMSDKEIAIARTLYGGKKEK